jgi:hypothetical protein
MAPAVQVNDVIVGVVPVARFGPEANAGRGWLLSRHVSRRHRRHSAWDVERRTARRREKDGAQHARGRRSLHAPRASTIRARFGRLQGGFRAQFSHAPAPATGRLPPVQISSRRSRRVGRALGVAMHGQSSVRAARSAST